MMEKKSNQLADVCAGVLTVLVFAYLTLRAIRIPFIHDEAVTYFTYIATNNFVPGYAYWDANNHLLFSALGALFNSMLGFSNLGVRLASLIFFPLYAYWAYKISRRFFKPLIGWVFFVVLIATPFVIEFFSLARGYGIGITFFMGLIYHISKQDQWSQKKHFVGLVVLAVLTLLGNLSFFMGVLSVVGFYFLGWVISQKPHYLKVVQRVMIFVFACLPLVVYIFELKSRNLLYYGGNELVGSFLKPFVNVFFKNTHIWPILLIPVGIAVGLIIWHVLKKGISLLDFRALFYSSLLASFIGIVLMQLLLHVNYPSDRAALYFFPLMVGAFMSLLNTLPKNITVVLLLPFIWFPTDFILTANTTHSSLWKYEHVPSRFYDQVKINESGFSETICARMLRKHIWSIGQYGNNEVSYVSSSDVPSVIADYILIDSVRRHKVDTSIYSVKDIDEISGQYLFERTQKLTWSHYLDTSIVEINTSNEYYNLFDFTHNPFDTAALKIHFSFTPTTDNCQYPLTLIGTVFDTTGGIIFYEKLTINERTANWKINEYKFMQYLPFLPGNSGRVVFYLYNPERHMYNMRKVKASLFTLSNESI